MCKSKLLQKASTHPRKQTLCKIVPITRMVKVKKTRKAPKGTKADKKDYMTIPEVRRSLEHIHSYVKTHPTVAAFRKEFKKVFGTEISEKSASEYLSVVSLEKGRGSQHGGAASIGYDMTPGSGGPSILPYVAGGVQLPVDSVARTCGQNCFLPPAADLGSNVFQKGGRRNTRKSRKQKGGAFPSLGTALSEFVSRPFGMSSPPSIGQDLTMLAKGGQFASPRPEINNPVIPTQTHIYNGSIAPVSKMF
jgi:hypothetical protein